MGGILAGVLFVLPSLLILIVLSWIYMAYGTLPVVAGVLYGIKPAVVAIVLGAAWRLGSRSLRNGWLIAIAVAALLSIAVLRLAVSADRAGCGAARHGGRQTAAGQIPAGRRAWR